MKSVCVLGNGQLGRMLRQAGEPLGITVWPVGAETHRDEIPFQHSVITAEIERWPETTLTRELACHPAFINRTVLPIIADRLTQKQLFDQLKLATAPWQWLTDPAEWPAIFTRLGEQVIVKRRSGGYDGRGQWRLHPHGTPLPDDENYGTCIVEQQINFFAEVSLIGARAEDGSTVFYPLTHNLHQAGILRASVAFPQSDRSQQAQAEDMLASIMHTLNYVGVMAMECFVTAEGLLINELAPRVHNSGHWTQNGASINQFELHLRAITGLPLPPPVVNHPSMMLNLIGCDLNYDWLTLPLVHLHWYDKTVTPGRKVGHLNITDYDPDRLQATLEALKTHLPAEYRAIISQAQALLRSGGIPS
ncbi:5-(carboxyamino)imidazole ribonucleotide synthase [Enterobacteriaceae bacterium ESL0689]|nr:5-(carboxyamino)imidazole ribonucleotide synthase [Enterobacteriaceae bacterium ESL0689]